uniref:Derlin n=1 Tax=Chaetoceros laevisporus TaxID=1937691 RepID=A0A8F5JA55_9STRA|nr:hypothetical protein Ycf90 [Chaetoceros laevisporus]
MQILLKLFLLLINIDQETVLNFFGIEDPNIYLNTGFEGAAVSTEISIETLKLIFQGLLEQYQYGLGLIDIENILLFITFLRFIILANRYNIKTSFYISCISLFAGFLWYIHLKDLVTWYGEMITYNRLTSRYIDDMMTEAYIEQSKNQSGMYLEFMNQNPLNFLKSSLVYASERDGYRIDPISMVVSSLPQSMKVQVTKWYYYLYNSFLPGIWNVVGKQLQEIAPLLMYVLIVRINKKYCPYFIRWHWTYLVVSSLFEGEIIRIIYRLYVYDTTILVPSGRFDESALLQPFFMIIVTTHYFLICLGLLHATCGQYFYIPFLTENTEIHIGKRPQNSIYSGGYTSWQEGSSKQVQVMTKDRKFVMLPRLWWGWFGKKNNTNEIEYRKNQQNQLRKNRLKGLKKIIRKLRKWILNN